MNKKIVAVLFLLLVVVSVTVSYRVLNQPAIQPDHSDGSSETLTEDDVADEIGNSFVPEDQDEVEIGEMV